MHWEIFSWSLKSLKLRAFETYLVFSAQKSVGFFEDGREALFYLFLMKSNLGRSFITKIIHTFESPLAILIYISLKSDYRMGCPILESSFISLGIRKFSYASWRESRVLKLTSKFFVGLVRLLKVLLWWYFSRPLKVDFLKKLSRPHRLKLKKSSGPCYFLTVPFPDHTN